MSLHAMLRNTSVVSLLRGWLAGWLDAAHPSSQINCASARCTARSCPVVTSIEAASVKNLRKGAGFGLYYLWKLPATFPHALHVLAGRI